MQVRSMGRWVLLFSAITVLAVAGGCHTLFTQSIRDGGVSDAQLQQLRYYLCREVTLARDVTESEARVAGTHALTIRNGRSIDYIVFPAGTVGTVVAAGGNWVDVKFERGPGRLRFISPGDEATPEDVEEFSSGLSVVVGEPTDLYRLGAADWDYGPMLMPWGLTETGWHGTIKYGGAEYVAIESSFSTCLQIDSDSVHTEKKTKRVVQGLDVSEVEAEERERARSSKRTRGKKVAPAPGDDGSTNAVPERRPARKAPPVEQD